MSGSFRLIENFAKNTAYYSGDEDEDSFAFLNNGMIRTEWSSSKRCASRCLSVYVQKEIRRENRINE